MALIYLNTSTGPSITVVGRSGNEMTFTLSEMLSFTNAIVERMGGFENRYNNTSGVGIYRGIRISELIDRVGRPDINDKILVVGSEGYNQTFTYLNVYPNSTIASHQGEMVLAFSFNGTIVPGYEDGYRVMFLPEDGLYENIDAKLTTPQQYYVGSAGARCVRDVVQIMVLPPS